MAICQFCREEIADDAIKCKFCGEYIHFFGKFIKLSPFFSFILLILLLFFMLKMNRDISMLQSGNRPEGEQLSAPVNDPAVDAISEILQTCGADIDKIKLPDEKEVAALEKRVKENPDDQEAEKQLLIYSGITEYKEKQEAKKEEKKEEKKKPVDQPEKKEDLRQDSPNQPDVEEAAKSPTHFTLNPLTQRTSCEHTEYLQEKIKGRINTRVAPIIKKMMINAGVRGISMTLSISAHRGQLKVFGHEPKPYKGNTYPSLNTRCYDTMKKIIDTWNVKNHACNDAVISFEYTQWY